MRKINLNNPNASAQDGQGTAPMGQVPIQGQPIPGAQMAGTGWSVPNQGIGAQPAQTVAPEPEKAKAPKIPKMPKGRQTGDAGAMETRVKKLTRATVVALSTAALGVTFGIYCTATSSAQLAQVKDGMTNVVVAAQQIQPGHTITDADLKVIEVPSTYVSTGASSDTKTFAGQVATVRIDENSQMTTGSLAAQKDGSSLANKLASGTKAATISVDANQGFSGLLKVGDTIDVMANTKGVNGTAVKRITSNAKVLALGSNLSDGDASYETVTVQVTPKEAATIRAAQAGNGVSLVLHPTVPTKE